MLNWNTVLEYVKGRLSLPSGFIEKTDDQIKDWITMKSIAEFSMWYPSVEFAPVVVGNSYYKGNPREGWYNFFDEENLTIIGIKDVYFPVGDAILTGHPITGPWSMAGFKCWMLQVFESNLYKPFTEWAYDFQFHEPNYVQIIPSLTMGSTSYTTFIVEYERFHPTDLRTIPGAMTTQFLDLCFADVGIWLGGMRGMYTTTQTPFGEIPLRAEELKSECIELRRELIDQWREDTIPPVTIEYF